MQRALGDTSQPLQLLVVGQSIQVAHAVRNVAEHVQKRNANKHESHFHVLSVLSVIPSEIKPGFYNI
jgi:hypothetical protein